MSERQIKSITNLSTLKNLKVKSKKSQNNNRQFKKHRLVLTIFRLTPKIISYARVFCKKLKKKNSHQILLFPGSHNQVHIVSPDRNQNLIKQYQKKYKNDWYPFYFSNCNVFVDNHHLTLFTKKFDMTTDFSHLGLGKVICFAQFVNFDSYSKKQQKANRQSTSILKIKRRQTLLQSLQSSLSQQNINNLKNKIINGINSFTIPEEEQLLKDQTNIKNIFFMGTDIGYLLLIDLKTKFYASTKVPSSAPISSISIYKNYVMVQSKNSLYFYTVEANRQSIKIQFLFNQKIIVTEGLYRPTFIYYSDFYFIFYIDAGTVKKIILKQRKLSNILYSENVCQPVIYNPFTNIKIFYQTKFKRILIIASCTKQILIYSYYFVENKTNLFYKLPNPKNPPMNPRVHIFSCIEFFQMPKKTKVSQNQRNLRQSQKRNSKQNQQNINIINQENEFYGSESSQNYFIIAVSFTERVYFIRAWENFCQLSKRAKFSHRVLKIQAYNDEGVIIVLHKTQQKTKQWVVQQQQAPNNQAQDTTRPKLLFIATLLNKIMSFTICTHTQILQKIQFELEINTKATISKNKFRTSLSLIDNQIMVLTQNNIQRIEFNSWRDIYNRMLQTENLQLLNFLILLKKYNSLFLKAPQCFDGLQKFFPTNDDQTKQILLQYYYEIKQQPPQVFIDEILNKRPTVLLPFILQHKIDNLCENSKQFLIQYWKNKDQRIVEELIMAGCEFGWQIAIKQGWMRALRKMVMMGIQIHFPLLKLSSFTVSEIQKLQKLDEIGNRDIEYETKCNEALTKINNYCLQTVQYTLLALECFLDPQQIQQLDDLKQFILTLLRPQILDNCIKYKPHQSIKIISKIFQAQQRTVLLDKLSIQDFIHSQKQFKNIVRINYLSVSQCIFSYISEIYRELTQIKSYTIDQQTKFRQLLAVQHAKMIHISMQNGQVQGDFLNAEYKNKKGKFQFTRPYLLDMLLILVSHNNQYLKQLVHQINVSVERDRQRFQCYMQDLLVKIWMDAMDSAVDNFQSDPNAITQHMTIQQIKSFMISLQQANTSNSYLLICLMLNLPKEQYCIKILRKFINSQNIIIQQRLFDWLLPTMQNLQDQQTRLMLQNQLMTHLKSLLDINKQKSRILFDKYFHNKQKQIIRRIDNDRPLQLQYLQMIIQDATQNEIQLQQNYLNLYLKLLISEQPQRVIKVLQQSFTKQKAGKIKYDLPQALRYSLDIEQYNQKHQIQTYLYQKLGEIQKCIASYLKILQILFWQYIDAYESKQQKDVKNNQNQNQTNQNQQKNQTYEYKQNDRMTKKLSIISQMISQKLHSKNDSMCIQLQQKISNYFKELAQLIYRQSIKKYQYLQIPLNAMISLSDLLKSQKLKYKGHYLGMIAFHFGRIIVQSFQKNWFQFFNQWLKNQVKIDLNSMKKYLFQGYSKIISQQNLLTNISFIDKTVLLQNVREVLIRMEESVHCEAICTICNNNFQQYQGESILFNCGHLFHAHCIQKDDNGQDYCWQCIYNNQIKAMIDHEQINMVSLLERYCMKKSKNKLAENSKKPKQQIISITKKRMNRLGIFDKKVTTLENQVQILDMKLQILEYYQSLTHND